MSSPPSTCTSASKFSVIQRAHTHTLSAMTWLRLRKCTWTLAKAITSTPGCLRSNTQSVRSTASFQNGFSDTLFECFEFLCATKRRSWHAFSLATIRRTSSFHYADYNWVEDGNFYKEDSLDGQSGERRPVPRILGTCQDWRVLSRGKAKVEQILNKDNKDGNNIVIEVDEELLIDNLTKMTMCLGTIPRVRVASVCKEVESVLNPFYAV